MMLRKPWKPALAQDARVREFCNRLARSHRRSPSPSEVRASEAARKYYGGRGLRKGAPQVFPRPKSARRVHHRALLSGAEERRRRLPLLSRALGVERRRPRTSGEGSVSAVARVERRATARLRGLDHAIHGTRSARSFRVGARPWPSATRAHERARMLYACEIVGGGASTRRSERHSARR